MGEPARKLPADWETETASENADPFRYGWRWRSVRLPNGKVIDEQIPLTAEDLLDPQPGDEVGQSQAHWELLFLLARILDQYYELRDDVTLVVDLKMFWGIPGSPRSSPDLSVVPGVREKFDQERRSFDVAKEGVRPCLIVEVVSSEDPEIRGNDYVKKVETYQQAGIPEYLLLDPPTSFTSGRLLLTGYRLGPDGTYQQIQPDSQGQLLSETTGLLFGVEEDGQALLVFEALTGRRLLDPKVERALETQARKAAEEQAAREAEARKAAEAEIVKLRAELEKPRKHDR
ncbi:MAG: Uma2 family endonuclease [Acidobacteria bacterium]|nr:Uma2 family endonuclease [Acidobacteriota bacterium]